MINFWIFVCFQEGNMIEEAFGDGEGFELNLAEEVFQDLENI